MIAYSSGAFPHSFVLAVATIVGSLRPIGGITRLLTNPPDRLRHGGARALRPPGNSLSGDGTAILEILHPAWTYPPGEFAMNPVLLFQRVLPLAYRLRRRFDVQIIDSHFGF